MAVMKLPLSAVDRVWRDELGTTVELIAVGLRDPAAPMRPGGLTTTKAVTKVSGTTEEQSEVRRSTAVHAARLPVRSQDRSSTTPLLIR